MRRLSSSAASLLIAVFLIPVSGFAETTPLDAAAVHARIVKRGVGRSLNIEERTGVVLSGKIAAIGADSFELQMKDDPAPVTVKYLDVADFPRGGMHGTTIFMLAGIGAAAAFTIWAVVHFHDVSQEHQLPALPSPPAFP